MKVPVYNISVLSKDLITWGITDIPSSTGISGGGGRTERTEEQRLGFHKTKEETRLEMISCYVDQVLQKRSGSVGTGSLFTCMEQLGTMDEQVTTMSPSEAFMPLETLVFGH